ncbi:hypothetical protein [Pyxidicoccus sp. MSG2]|uniref:hypothetical protein n=1 Tax=Pyxidicoccus sp. MSG2 TaxID=2996790 RepID=UPI002270520D|nr:hypothetical protein [Pyxidicoccus sp. MSG2]MCY1022554.1 hypothetical protein [Pyxidicoccus sp. MSG2]
MADQSAALYCYSVCGDNVCDVNSEVHSCPADCGPNECGNHVCCGWEDPSNCPEDCPYASDYCYFTPPTLTGKAPERSPGTRREQPRNTPSLICIPECGDNLCDINTEAYSCPADCGINTCGDSVCCTENPSICPQDCPYASDYCYFTPPF